MLTPIRSFAAIALSLAIFASLASCTTDADNSLYRDQTTPSPNRAGHKDSVLPPSPGGPVRNQNNDPDPAEPPASPNRQQPANRWYVQSIALHSLA